MRIRNVLLILILAAVLVTISGSAFSDARAITPAGSVLSGGGYVLTIRSAAVEKPGGYLLLNSSTAEDTTSGCCCKSFLPCIQR
jgi:hypothetical protein